MTATTERTAEEFRESFERLWEDYRNGDASPGWVDQTIADHRPDLSPWARWAIWEQLDDALTRLACLRTPGGCCCHDYAPADAEHHEHMADADAENAVLNLTGGAA